MTRLLRAKLVHFFVLGLALYGLNKSYWVYQQRELQCPSASQLEAAVANWAQQNRRPMTTKIQLALRQNALDEQMLVREAQLQGLHKRDQVVQQRLQRDAEFLGIAGSRAAQIEAVLSMGLLDSDEVIRRRLIQIQEQEIAAGVAAHTPSEQDLKRLYAANPALSQVSPRYSFEQRFFAGDAIASKMLAEQVLVRLNRGESLHDGDVFLSGEVFNELSSSEINTIFGADFWPKKTVGITFDRWFGPLHSVFGWHLIKLQGYSPEASLAFAEVRPELEGIWRREQQRLAWLNYVTELRGQYRVLCHDKG